MPSMVSAERMRSRISDCQPCEMSSLVYILGAFGSREKFQISEVRLQIEKRVRNLQSEIYNLKSSCLLNMHVARPRPHRQQRAAAADFAADVFARLLHATLHCHFDRRVYVD